MVSLNTNHLLLHIQLRRPSSLTLTVPLRAILVPFPLDGELDGLGYKDPDVLPRCGLKFGVLGVLPSLYVSLEVRWVVVIAAAAPLGRRPKLGGAGAGRDGANPYGSLGSRYAYDILRNPIPPNPPYRPNGKLTSVLNRPKPFVCPMRLLLSSARPGRHARGALQGHTHVIRRAPTTTSMQDFRALDVDRWEEEALSAADLAVHDPRSAQELLQIAKAKQASVRTKLAR